MAVWKGRNQAQEACDSFEVRGKEGVWTSKLKRGPYGCGLWGIIRMDCEDFRRYIWYEVGTGNRVRFQLDYWYGDQSLKEAFPVLYEFATDQEAQVLRIFIGEEKRSWDVQFHRALND